jgi:hypothetical protein
VCVGGGERGAEYLLLIDDISGLLFLKVNILWLYSRAAGPSGSRHRPLHPQLRHDQAEVMHDPSSGYIPHPPSVITVERGGFIERGGFNLFISFVYFIPHSFICRPLDSTMWEDAGIEPRTVATLALAVRRSNHSAKSHPRMMDEILDDLLTLQSSIPL